VKPWGEGSPSTSEGGRRVLTVGFRDEGKTLNGRASLKAQKWKEGRGFTLLCFRGRERRFSRWDVLRFSHKTKKRKDRKEKKRSVRGKKMENS